MVKKIELLAPARNLEAAVAAVDWGTDALYMGAPRFGARYAAGNPVDDIARAVEYARRYGVRVYATLNTLLFEDELDEARQTAIELMSSGVDALIIQDMAYLEMGLTGVEFHASTQTFNASAEKVRFLQEAGFSRVILERGLTFEEIKAIRQATGVELECFVHGAICVGYSGRCWLSRSMGPRSGNRGQCSQPCRQTYDLVDDAGNIVIRSKHLLSVQDLDLSERLGELMDAGISSFKIEGRLKETDYVKNTVGYYRRRLDEEMAKRPGFARASAGTSVRDVVPDLSKTFTRGRSEYYFAGKGGGAASFDTPKAIGDYAGKVVRTGKEWFEIDSPAELAPGDGICFVMGGELAGTNINRVEGRRVFPNRDRIPEPGTAVYRNYDRLFSVALERSRTRRVIDVSATATVADGAITLRYADTEGNVSEITRAGDWPPARDPGKMLDTIRLQAAKSGETIFRVIGVDVETMAGTENGAGAGAEKTITEAEAGIGVKRNVKMRKGVDVGMEIKAIAGTVVPFIPVSELNAIRREALERLTKARLSVPPARNVIPADRSFPYPHERLGGSENVTNSLSEKFWRSHGVREIAPPLELKHDLSGECVMRTPYCIRREMGECLKEAPRLKGGLWLEHGAHRYRLDFDCVRCEMSLVKE